MKAKYLFLILAVVVLTVVAGCGEKKTGYITYGGQYADQPAAQQQQQYPVAGCEVTAPAVTDEPVEIGQNSGL